MPILRNVNFFVVAHPDDIELFMAQALIDSIRTKTKTILIVTTAGDDGKGYQEGSTSCYWYLRSLGHEKATMFLVNQLQAGIGKLTSRTPAAQFNNVYLYNLMLPDKALPKLSGRPRTVLSCLEDGTLPSVKTIDGKRGFTRQHLVTELFRLYKKHTSIFETPSIHVTDEGSDLETDHADHHATTRLALESFALLNKRKSRILRYQTYLNEGIEATLTREETLLHAAVWGIYNSHILQHYPGLSGRMQTKYLGKQRLTSISNEHHHHSN